MSPKSVVGNRECAVSSSKDGMPEFTRTSKVRCECVSVFTVDIKNNNSGPRKLGKLLEDRGSEATLAVARCAKHRSVARENLCEGDTNRPKTSDRLSKNQVSVFASGNPEDDADLFIAERVCFCTQRWHLEGVRHETKLPLPPFKKTYGHSNDVSQWLTM